VFSGSGISGIGSLCFAGIIFEKDSWFGHFLIFLSFYLFGVGRDKPCFCLNPQAIHHQAVLYWFYIGRN
jgi:hypothetical protein